MSDIVIRTRVDAKGSKSGLGEVKKEVQDLGKTGPKAVQPLTRDFKSLKDRMETVRHSMRGVIGTSETLQESALSLSGKGLLPLLGAIVAVRAAWGAWQNAARIDPQLGASVSTLRSEWQRWKDETSHVAISLGGMRVSTMSLSDAVSGLLKRSSDNLQAMRNQEKALDRLVDQIRAGKIGWDEYLESFNKIVEAEKQREWRRKTFPNSTPQLGPDYANLVDRMLANDAAALTAGPPAPPGWRPPEAPPFSMGLEELSDIYFPRQHQRRTSPMPDFTADQLEGIERIKDAQAEALSEWSDGYQRMATNMENAIVGAFQASRGGVDQLGQYAFDVIYEALAKAIAKAFVGNLLGKIGSIGLGAATGGGSAAVGGVSLGGGTIGLGGSQTIGGLQVANQLRSQRVG